VQDKILPPFEIYKQALGSFDPKYSLSHLTERPEYEYRVCCPFCIAKGDTYEQKNTKPFCINIAEDKRYCQRCNRKGKSYKFVSKDFISNGDGNWRKNRQYLIYSEEFSGACKSEPHEPKKSKYYQRGRISITCPKLFGTRRQRNL